MRLLPKKILSPLEKVADEIIEAHLRKNTLTEEEREYARNIIADCLFCAIDSEKQERFFEFAMGELRKRQP